MKTHHLVGWHPKKGLELINREDLLRLRLCKVSVVPNARWLRRGPLFPFIYLGLLLKQCDFLHRSSRGSDPRWCRNISHRNSRQPLIHNTNPPLPKGKERFVLLCPHFCIHILIKFCRHLCKRKEGKHFKKKKKLRERKRRR